VLGLYAKPDGFLLTVIVLVTSIVTVLDKLFVVELAYEDVLLLVDDVTEFVVALPQEISINDVKRRKQITNKYNFLFILSPLFTIFLHLHYVRGIIPFRYLQVKWFKSIENMLKTCYSTSG
jgi:hypothetical protein